MSAGILSPTEEERDRGGYTQLDIGIDRVNETRRREKERRGGRNKRKGGREGDVQS